MIKNMFLLTKLHMLLINYLHKMYGPKRTRSMVGNLTKRAVLNVKPNTYIKGILPATFRLISPKYCSLSTFLVHKK